MNAFPKPKESQVFPGSPKEKDAIRSKVFLRDRGRCVDCHKPLWVDDSYGLFYAMHLMHIKSKGSGGDWSLSNLLTGCFECHAKRHNAGGKPVPPKGNL